MPNHAASVFKQLAALAIEHGKEIGTFAQSGTTFHRNHASLRIDPQGITYHIESMTATGKEEHMGRFALTDKALTRNLIKMLHKSLKTNTKYYAKHAA